MKDFKLLLEIARLADQYKTNLPDGWKSNCMTRLELDKATFAVDQVCNANGKTVGYVFLAKNSICRGDSHAVVCNSYKNAVLLMTQTILKEIRQ